MYALAKGGGAIGNVGLSLSLMQYSNCLLYKILDIICKIFAILLKLLIALTVSLWNWNWFRCEISLFLFGKKAQILSDPANILACSLPKFSLKCRAAISNLYVALSEASVFHSAYKAYLEYIPP